MKTGAQLSINFDAETETFTSKLQAKIWEAGLNPHKVAKIAGIDYPLFTKMMNDKYPFTENFLIRLGKLPFLTDLVAQERFERLYVSEEHDVMVNAINQVLTQHIKRNDDLSRQQKKKKIQQLLETL